MKNILIIILTILSFSVFSQTVKVNEQGQIVKTETTVIETTISTNQIDSQIKSYKQMIEQLTMKIEELNTIRTEVETLEEKTKLKVKKQ